MAEFLLRGLLMVCCFLLVQSLQCYNCRDVPDPAQCESSKWCGINEICFTERVQGNNGRPFYNLGCVNNVFCTNGHFCYGTPECVSYCTTHKCNTKSCLESGTGNVKEERSCREFKRAGYPSGVYTLNLRDGLPPFQVYCDMDTAGGGWTVFQKRKDGSVNFFLGWHDYKKGFGKLRGEFWLGNDYLHRLTKAGLTTLRVDMKDWESNTRYAQYSRFRVEPGCKKYRLSISGYSGNAGDSLSYQGGMAFSTKDVDNDIVHSRNCAKDFIGAWWYKDCHVSNLNGKYYYGGKAPNGKGVVWREWHGQEYSLKSVEMKLREP